jgi:hypothetical protein
MRGLSETQRGFLRKPPPNRETAAETVAMSYWPDVAQQEDATDKPQNDQLPNPECHGSPLAHPRSHIHHSAGEAIAQVPTGKNLHKHS